LSPAPGCRVSAAGLVASACIAPFMLVRGGGGEPAPQPCRLCAWPRRYTAQTCLWTTYSATCSTCARRSRVLVSRFRAKRTNSMGTQRRRCPMPPTTRARRRWTSALTLMLNHCWVCRRHALTRCRSARHPHSRDTYACRCDFAAAAVPIGDLSKYCSDLRKIVTASLGAVPAAPGSAASPSSPVSDARSVSSSPSARHSGSWRSNASVSEASVLSPTTAASSVVGSQRCECRRRCCRCRYVHVPLPCTALSRRNRCCSVAQLQATNADRNASLGIALDCPRVRRECPYGRRRTRSRACRGRRRSRQPPRQPPPPPQPKPLLPLPGL
jgi:hypothetical protein